MSRWKVILLGITALVLVIAVPTGIWYATQETKKATANYRGDVALKENTRANADFRRQAYDHFFDICAQVQTKETAIKTLLPRWHTETDQTTKARVADNIAANQITRADLINQYNVDAKKSWTVGQFQSSDLPYQLSVSAKETQCTA